MNKNIYLLILGTMAATFLPFAASASTLSSSCTGVSASASIAWTASSTGGVPPIAYLWGNGATSTMQTVSEGSGTYSMTLQATDASSSVATTTCSATIAQPVATSTSTADQIAGLLEQIAALKAQLSQLLAEQAASFAGGSSVTPNSTSTSCLSFGEDLHVGDHGNNVEDLQKVLAGDPAIFSSSSVTGYFGPLTEDATKKFQEKHGILSTGYFGPMSRKYIGDQCSTGDSNHDGIPNSLDQATNPELDSENSTSSSSIPSHGNTESGGIQPQQSSEGGN